MIRRVFVSSTLEDLINHRQAVNEALRRLGLQTVEVTENLPETNLYALQQADVFLGIYASRYGESLRQQDISLTERLYDEALHLGIPRLIYVVSPHETWPAEFLQTTAQDGLMRMFVERLTAENPHLRTFTNPSDLADKIIFDLGRLKADSPARTPNWRQVVIGLLIIGAVLGLVLGSLRLL